jgi:hypothetical protein
MFVCLTLLLTWFESPFTGRKIRFLVFVPAAFNASLGEP